LWISADEFFGRIKWPQAAPGIRIKASISPFRDESDDCRFGVSDSYGLQPIQARRKTAYFFRPVPDRRNGICLWLPDDVLQFHIPESRWTMHLQHATEKRNRFKNSGPYPCRLGIWPGKNHFPEKPIDSRSVHNLLSY
jgi:hypothetical protein